MDLAAQEKEHELMIGSPAPEMADLPTYTALSSS